MAEMGALAATLMADLACVNTNMQMVFPNLFSLNLSRKVTASWDITLIITCVVVPRAFRRLK